MSVRAQSTLSRSVSTPKKYKSLKDLPEGGKIIMRDAVSEEGRILSIFEKEGVIKLKPGIDKVTARISDIVENPKKLQFTPNVEASLLPQMYNNDEGAAVVINANYAIDAGLGSGPRSNCG